MVQFSSWVGSLAKKEAKLVDIQELRAWAASLFELACMTGSLVMAAYCIFDTVKRRGNV